MSDLFDRLQDNQPPTEPSAPAPLPPPAAPTPPPSPAAKPAGNGLGRGLGDLIQEAAVVRAVPPPSAAQSGYLCLPLDQIRVPPARTARPEASPMAWKAFLDSVREFGVLQPVLVRKVAEGYELIAGMRRLRAAQDIHLREIPAIVRAATDDEAYKIAMIENLQRKSPAQFTPPFVGRVYNAGDIPPMPMAPVHPRPLPVPPRPVSVPVPAPVKPAPVTPPLAAIAPEAPVEPKAAAPATPAAPPPAAEQTTKPAAAPVAGAPEHSMYVAGETAGNVPPGKLGEFMPQAALAAPDRLGLPRWWPAAAMVALLVIILAGWGLSRVRHAKSTATPAVAPAVTTSPPAPVAVQPDPRLAWVEGIRLNGVRVQRLPDQALIAFTEPLFGANGQLTPRGRSLLVAMAGFIRARGGNAQVTVINASRTGQPDVVRLKAAGDVLSGPGGLNDLRGQVVTDPARDNEILLAVRPGP